MPSAESPSPSPLLSVEVSKVSRWPSSPPDGQARDEAARTRRTGMRTRYIPPTIDQPRRPKKGADASACEQTRVERESRVMVGDRRALSNVGGPVEARGDVAYRVPLAEAMRAQDDPVEPALTHGFHAYPARMHANVARVLLHEFFVGPGSEVLDPFCGSGTVAVEALAGGWRALGSDLDPLALRVARVKTERRGDKARARFLSRVQAVAAASERRVRERVDVRANLPKAEREWYEVHVLKELAGLLEEIRAVADERDRLAMEMVFSAIV